MAAPDPIITAHQFVGWAAYRASYEPPDRDGVGGGLVGWGKTEAEAVTDLLEQEEDHE